MLDLAEQLELYGVTFEQLASDDLRLLRDIYLDDSAIEWRRFVMHADTAARFGELRGLTPIEDHGGGRLSR